MVSLVFVNTACTDIDKLPQWWYRSAVSCYHHTAVWWSSGANFHFNSGNWRHHSHCNIRRVIYGERNTSRPGHLLLELTHSSHIK